MLNVNSRGWQLFGTLCVVLAVGIYLYAVGAVVYTVVMLVRKVAGL